MTSTKALSADTRALAVIWVGHWFDPFVAPYTRSREAVAQKAMREAMRQMPMMTCPVSMRLGRWALFLKTVKLLHALAQ